MRMLRLPAAAVALSMMLLACVPLPGTRTPPANDSAQRAQALYTRGQFEQSADAYMTLAGQDAQYSDYYRLLAAESWRQGGKLDRSEQALANVRRNHLEGEDAIRFDLLRAEFALRRNDPATALSLAGNPEHPISPGLMARLLEVRARAQAAGGDHWSAAQTRIGMDASLTGIDREHNRKLALAELVAMGADNLAATDARLGADDHLKPWVHEAQTQLGVAVARAPAQLAQPVGTVGAGGQPGVREGYRAPTAVALLLPASGPLSSAGNVVRDGFFAAYLDAGRNGAPRPSVKVYDSGNDAAHTLSAYDQAVKDGATLVVGPLNRDGVAALFGRGALSVPVLALNHPTERVLPPGGASEFGLLPEAEGAQVADHMIDRGITSAVAMLSSDDFASRAGKAFAAEYAARGGKLTRTITLPVNAVNFSDQIDGIDSAEGSGIFISMKPQQARLLLPQLRLAKVTAPVFGTSHIYAGVDDATSDKDLDGVEFCDAPWMFDAQPGLPRRGDLSAGLTSVRGVNARLFAFGMDAWALVPYVDWLRSHVGSYLPGASGQLTADEFGRVRRVLTWARFQDGLARPVAGSLEMDAPAATGIEDSSSNTQ
ncbi:penicillin-binding protein activator [Pinirhizobacter sp.]|uniref:penicillin-binding protein activator n=1 Tax=Pinirhizobacter sp. TaxID=2950432 RepID=UPI002F40894F